MTTNCLDSWMNAETPHLVMRQLRADGWLREHAPEIDRLYGVPQRPEHHPEIDVGIHIELVLEMASLLTRDPRVRYAALVHDLGKGLTPAADWPRHHNHEELGVEPVLELSERLGVPEDWQRLGVLVARFHLRAHKALEASARSLVRLFRDAELFEQPYLVKPFTIASEADARGRAGLQGRAYPQAQRIRQAFAIANAAVIAHENQNIHDARVHAVDRALESC